MATFAANSDASKYTLANMIVLAVITGSLTHVNLCLLKGGLIDKGLMS
jgi:hypothetical protein